MSTINRTQAAQKNNNIGAEYARGVTGKYQTHDDKLDGERKFGGKKKSDATRAKEAAELRTNRRSNWCGVCNMTRATGTGVCGCDE
jgi:hypothetical protein